jgi:hypothetical protein
LTASQPNSLEAPSTSSVPANRTMSIPSKASGRVLQHVERLSGDDFVPFTRWRRMRISLAGNFPLTEHFDHFRSDLQPIRPNRLCNVSWATPPCAVKCGVVYSKRPEAQLAISMRTRFGSGSRRDEKTLCSSVEMVFGHRAR